MSSTKRGQRVEQAFRPAVQAYIVTALAAEVIPDIGFCAIGVGVGPEGPCVTRTFKLYHYPLQRNSLSSRLESSELAPDRGPATKQPMILVLPAKHLGGERQRWINQDVKVSLVLEPNRDAMKLDVSNQFDFLHGPSLGVREGHGLLVRRFEGLCA